MSEKVSKNIRWALILGGSSGMGLATARYLWQKGYHLILVYRERRGKERELQKEWANWSKQGQKLITYNRDAIDATVVEAILNDLKKDEIKISLLLHSIARGNLKPIISGKPEDEDGGPSLKVDDFLLTFEAMAANYFLWAQALFQAGRLAENASLLALSSEGSVRAWPQYAAVSAAKAALEAISRSLALEMAPHGIRSNILRAGVTDTAALRSIAGFEKLLDQSETRNPSGRSTRPEDVARAVYMISSEEGKWINGAVIPVDGGEGIA